MVNSMRLPDVTNSPSKVQLSRISHVYFEHADLAKFEQFASDFGLQEAHREGDTVYYRGYGRDQFVYVARQSPDGVSRFGGGAFVAASRKEFDKAAQVPGATTKILNETLGGGELITFVRPNDTLFHVIYGQREREVDFSGESLPTATHISHGPLNMPFDKPRRGQFQRYQPGPALIHKLGHYGYTCAEFDTEFAWYTENFNFVPSDVLYLPSNPDMDIVTFIHLDLGKDFSDHHSLFLARADPSQNQQTALHHTSFEVEDFDTQLMSHYFLASKKYESVWGVGRHVLGSQIFDYWRDTSGFVIEHYADGDVVNMSTRTKRDEAGKMSVWGPEVPKDFTG